MKAETLRALKNARDLAMKNTLAARIPECGDFGHIAQDLDYVLNDIEAYTAPPRVADVEIERIAKGLAESNGWDDWDTAKNVTDTPAGNEPEEEREWYRDMVKFVVSALEQSK